MIYTGKKYKVNNNIPVEGIISVHKTGIKSIIVNGKTIPINNRSLYYVLDKDKVKAHIIDNEAYICEIIERNKDILPFQVVLKDGVKVLELIGGTFNIKNINIENYNVGDALLINITTNKIIRKIADNNNPNKRDIAIGAKYGFDNYYSDKYLEEIEQIKELHKNENYEGRLDFREMPLYTVDCDNTRDIDDSTGLIRSDHDTIYIINNFADTSHYIKYGGEIYNLAYQRGTSGYSQNYVFPMLHSVLSNDICSLNPHENRLTKSVITEIDYNGNVISTNIGYGVMNSKKKMKYSEVDKLLTTDPNLNNTYLPFKDNLELFRETSNILKKFYLNRGKIEFINDEYNVEFDENMVAKQLVELDGPISRKMIEYVMINGNENCTKILSDAGMPLIYRNHLKQDREIVDKTMLKLKEMGFDTDIYFKTGSIPKFLDQYKDDKKMLYLASKYILSSPIVTKAYFSEKNEGHWALAVDRYSRLSSSIRLLDNLHNHYCFDAYMTKDDELKEKLKKNAKDVAEQCNIRAKAAEEFEEETDKCYCLDIAKRNIGNEYEGLVIDNRYGKTFIKLSNGLYGSLPDDYNLELGDTVLVNLAYVNDNTKEIGLIYKYVLHKRHSAKKRVKK